MRQMRYRTGKFEVEEGKIRRLACSFDT